MNPESFAAPHPKGKRQPVINCSIRLQLPGHDLQGNGAEGNLLSASVYGATKVYVGSSPQLFLSIPSPPPALFFPSPPPRYSPDELISLIDVAAKETG